MKKELIVFIVLVFLSTTTDAQTWEWAKSAHGAFDDWGQSTAVDVSGNTFVAGMFTSTSITFGNTVLKNTDSTNTGNSGFSMDIFLVKYDVTGNVLWAKSVEGTDNMDERVFSIAVDGIGNVYLAGMYSSPTLSFDSITITNAGIENIFLAKYDPNGNALWAKSTGGSYHDWAYSVAVDNSGNIYMTGVFQSPTISFGSITLTNDDNTGNYTDLFLAKYDTDGNVLWAKSAGGTSYDWAMSVSVDASDKVLVSGYFYGPTLTFGSIDLTNVNAMYGDTFIAKYDESGNVIWAKSAGGTFDDAVYSVAADSSGNIYMTGNFRSPTLTFGTTTLTNTGESDIFLAKYNADGDVLWAKSAIGSDSDIGNSVATDVIGNAYLTGHFYSPTITFETTTLTNAGSADIYLVKYDINGNLLWAKSVGGTDNDGAVSVAMDAFDNAYITGWFRDICSFGSTTLINDGGSFNGSDVFIAKLSSTTEIHELANTLDISVFPNPSEGKFRIKIVKKQLVKGNDYIAIYNLSGNRIYFSEFTSQTPNEIDLSAFPKGIYFVNIYAGGETHTEKIVLR